MLSAPPQNREGRCRLCLEQKRLHDSHFIPQAAYKLIRGSGRNPNPLHVRPGKAVQTSAQVKDYLLCGECEQRLAEGEDTFFRYCCGGAGDFTLLEMLRAQPPITADIHYAVYAVPESEHGSVQKVGYMGVSVFWKSAAHTWRDNGRTIPGISLGRAYQEDLRQFLLGIAPFPENAGLIVEVSGDNNRMLSVAGMPASSKHPSHWVHWVDLFGVRFTLMIGRGMPQQFRQLSVFTSGPKLVLLAKRHESTMANDYRELLNVLTDRR
jgi:hypothetical protein